MAAPNTKQRIALIDISANTIAQIQAHLDTGKVVHQIVSLLPDIKKLLIIYYDPDLDPTV